MFKKFAVAAIGMAALYSGSAQAQTCIGNCGTLGPDGVVTAPPAFGPNYQYVSSAGGVTGAGEIASVGGTNGSEYLTAAFAGVAGDKLNFYFNFVTADGTSAFPDYAFAELLNGSVSVGYLFTARTTTSGNTSPGFGLPANISTLTPATTPIIPGGPVWSALGGSSGVCFGGSGGGCGYTGWIGSSYTLTGTGLFQLRFGATNFGDTAVDTGLAFAGVTVNDIPVTPSVPEPATWGMMILGFGLAGGALRAGVRRSNTTFDAKIKRIAAGANA